MRPNLFVQWILSLIYVLYGIAHHWTEMRDEEGDLLDFFYHYINSSLSVHVRSTTTEPLFFGSVVQFT